MSEYAEFNGTQEEAESFLNENIELAKEWILKHVPRRTLEGWMSEKRLTVRGEQSISIRQSSQMETSTFEQAHDCFLLLITRLSTTSDRPYHWENQAHRVGCNLCRPVASDLKLLQIGFCLLHSCFC